MDAWAEAAMTSPANSKDASAEKALGENISVIVRLTDRSAIVTAHHEDVKGGSIGKTNATFP
jgi:hypothetical protein